MKASFFPSLFLILSGCGASHKVLTEHTADKPLSTVNAFTIAPVESKFSPPEASEVSAEKWAEACSTAEVAFVGELRSRDPRFGKSGFCCKHLACRETVRTPDASYLVSWTSKFS